MNVMFVIKKKLKLPDKTARSLTLKPTEANFSFSWVISMDGSGSPVKASAASDLFPSRRPVRTGQVGPPIYKKNGKKEENPFN